jgi:hypothetical protein
MVFGGGMHTFSHRLGASAVSISVDGRRGGGVCLEAAGASRWWEFVGLRVGVATNVGRSVYIVERHDVKDFRRKLALWAHHGHVNSRKDCRGVRHTLLLIHALYTGGFVSFLWGPAYTKFIQMGPTLYIFLVGNCIRYTVPIQSVYHRGRRAENRGDRVKRCSER